MQVQVQVQIQVYVSAHSQVRLSSFNLLRVIVKLEMERREFKVIEWSYRNMAQRLAPYST